LSLVLLAAMAPRPSSAQQVSVIAAGKNAMAPATADGIVYFLSDDSRLYAVNAADGSPVSGFPADIAAAVNDGSKPIGRPSIYDAGDGKGIYVATDNGGVVRFGADGAVKWVYKGASDKLYVPNVYSPALTADGDVFAVSTYSGAGHVIKLRAADGGFVIASPGMPNASALAVVDGYVYSGNNGATVLNTSDLSIRAGLGSSSTNFGPAYIVGNSLFMASNTGGGYLYKANRTTLAFDATFAGAGAASVSADGVNCIFADTTAKPAPKLYAATGGLLWPTVYEVDGATGATKTLIQTPLLGIPYGIVINRSNNTLAFSCIQANISTGEVKYVLYQVSIADPVNGVRISPNLQGELTLPAFDPITKRFFVGSTGAVNGILYGFDSM
jgi:outer membrane protein assembly factor BamB